MNLSRSPGSHWNVIRYLYSLLEQALRISLRRVSLIGWAAMAGAGAGYPVACGVSIISLAPAVASAVGVTALVTELGYGYMAFGGVVGAVLFVPLGNRYPPARMVGLSVLLCGGLVAVVPLSGPAFVIVALLAGGGVGVSADFAPVYTERLERLAPGASRVRGQWFVAIQVLPFPVGLLARWLDVYWALGTLGGLGVMLAIAMFLAPPGPAEQGDAVARWAPLAVVSHWKALPATLCVQLVAGALLLSIVVSVIPPLAVQAGLDSGWIGAFGLTVLGAAIIHPRLQRRGPMWSFSFSLIGAALLSLGGLPIAIVVSSVAWSLQSMALSAVTGASIPVLATFILLGLSRLLVQSGMNAVLVAAQNVRRGRSGEQAFVQAKIRLLWLSGATVGLFTGPATLRGGIQVVVIIACATAAVGVLATLFAHRSGRDPE